MVNWKEKLIYTPVFVYSVRHVTLSKLYIRGVRLKDYKLLSTHLAAQLNYIKFF